MWYGPIGIALAVAAANSSPAERESIIAAAAAIAPQGTAFDRTTRTVREGGGSTTSSKRTDRWNGRGWSLVSVAGKAPSRDQQEQYRRIIRTLPMPGYHQLAPILAAASSSSSDAQGRTWWYIPQLPAGSVVTDSGDISAHLRAEARVARDGNGPWIDQLRISQREPFKLNVLIKVTAFSQTMDYALGPDGKPRLVAQTSQSIGNMFGFPGGEKAEVTFVYR